MYAGNVFRVLIPFPSAVRVSYGHIVFIILRSVFRNHPVIRVPQRVAHYLK